ncbi:MAG: ribonuclease R [Bacteroidales bacterium]|nr:ribonuclease R [Bacteroidales bacterium]
MNKNKKDLIKEIITVFRQNPKKVLNFKQVSHALELKDDALRKVVENSLKSLTIQELIEEESPGKYKLKIKVGYINGIVDMTASGSAYIVSKEIEDDVFIAQQNLNHALNGDEVKVYLFPKSNKSRPEGEVVEILKEGKRSFVGILEKSKNYAFAVIENKSMPYDIFIPESNLGNAQDGQKVIVKITEWPQKAKNPIGQITDVLGEPGVNETEMHAILAEFGLPYHFPKHVDEVAEKISDKITAEEIAKRWDFRNVTTFTIDPVDAKDFDDALSLRKLENGLWEVGVHIADVTHYMDEGGIIDMEGQTRATSVYLVDRVVPMLPERLSNFLCSLRPHEEKLCFSAVFQLDDNADIKKEWFGRTVIYSDRRFSYEEAQEVIETGKGDLKEEIFTLDALAKKLRKKRFDDGAIGFERKEVKFNIDENGKPLGVFFKESKDANKLIEEFMLLANKRVAEFVGKKENAKTFVYRIHDEPDLQKLSDFAKFIKLFGYSINAKSKKSTSKSINELLDNLEGKKERNILETLAVRTMAKAVYSTQNIGHYGLAFDHYTHFTSPIRRYPDVMVHRLLARYLDNKKSANQEEYEDLCKHSSDMEQKSALAERASIKYKQVEFMKDKVGEIYTGVISGVTEWGLYVEIIENQCEGMISVRDLDDDQYIIDERNYCFRGKFTNKVYALGDEITIKIAAANLAKKQLDFVLEGHVNQEKKGEFKGDKKDRRKK